MDKSAKEEIRELFVNAIRNAHTKSLCPACGFAMQEVTLAFTFGNGGGWTLPLPVCFNCCPELLKGLRAPEAGLS
jgi:hypothetical protein